MGQDCKCVIFKHIRNRDRNPKEKRRVVREGNLKLIEMKLCRKIKMKCMCRKGNV